MNSVANGKVRANTPFEEVYIQPAAADNGTALGAAYHLWHEHFDAPRSFVMNHTLWGTEYSDDRVPELVADQPEAASKYKWTHYDDLDRLCEKTAQLLADGKVVGWFRGADGVGRPGPGAESSNLFWVESFRAQRSGVEKSPRIQRNRQNRGGFYDQSLDSPDLENF